MDNKEKRVDAAIANDNPTRILKYEHAATLLKLELMQRALQYLQGAPGNTVPERIEVEKALLRDLVGALEETIRLHFQKEEEALFPVLAEYIGKEHGPIEVMLHEHQKIRSVFDALKGNLQDFGGSAAPVEEGRLKVILASGFEAVRLLRSHIGKENEVLFRICETSLSEEEKKEVARKMKAVCIAPVRRASGGPAL